MMMFIAAAAALAALAQACGILLLVLSHRRTPRIGPADVIDARTRPFVSIIVPARNEAENIGRCLHSLVAQDYSEFEIIAVDDQSVDQTRTIVSQIAAEHGRVRLVDGAACPPDWAGKPHALAQGAAIARGSFLLFVDADVELHPACLRQAVAYAEHTGTDLLTLCPRVVNDSFWEHVVQSAVVQLILTVFPADRVNDPADRTASANGPFLLFRRSAYETIGGHTAVRDDIVEDLTLARLVKRSGLRLAWCVGVDIVSLRMYRSLKAIWNGWSKNFYAAVEGKPAAAVAGFLFMVGLFVLPWVLIPIAIGGAIAGTRGSTLAVIATASVPLVAWWWRRELARRYRVDSAWWYLQPVGFAIAAAILLNSARVSLARQPIEWRGRVVGPYSAAPPTEAVSRNSTEARGSH